MPVACVRRAVAAAAPSPRPQIQPRLRIPLLPSPGRSMSRGRALSLAPADASKGLKDATQRNKAIKMAGEAASALRRRRCCPLAPRAMALRRCNPTCCVR